MHMIMFSLPPVKYLSALFLHVTCSTQSLWASAAAASASAAPDNDDARVRRKPHAHKRTGSG